MHVSLFSAIKELVVFWSLESENQLQLTLQHLQAIFIKEKEGIVLVNFSLIQKDGNNDDLGNAVFSTDCKGGAFGDKKRGKVLSELTSDFILEIQMG